MKRKRDGNRERGVIIRRGISWETKSVLVASTIIIILLMLAIWIAWDLDKDERKIMSTEFDAVFLSMYPLDTYREEDYATLRGGKIMIASYRMPHISAMEIYMEEIQKSGNEVHTAYLGIRPDLTDWKELQAFIDSYPDIAFEIVIANPSADYWRGLSQQGYEALLAAYERLLAAIPDMSGTNFYFMSDQEWLICNPSNYKNHWLLAEDAASKVMAYSYTSPYYQVKDPEAAVRSLREVTQRLRLEPEEYPDLSKTCVLFFGDSVIGNYTDSMSIPGVVNGLTGACVYNFGYGGDSAALGADGGIGLPGILEAFFQEDLSKLPSEGQTYIGMASYLGKPPKGKKLCFVINYGLNDYFKGHAVSSEDPYDVHTYCGAIRTAVKTIRDNAPDAQIVLCTPNFITEWEEGTEPHGSEGSVLADYVTAEIALARELEVDLLDNYHELGINAGNSSLYLDDKVHPSLACRYLMGKRLCGAIR